MLLVARSCLTLCEPMDCSLPASSIQGILQAEILEWVAFFCSRGSSWPRDWTWVSWIAGGFYPIWATRKQWAFVVTRVEELGLWCSVWQPRLFWCHSELRNEDLVTSSRLSAGHYSTLEHLSGQTELYWTCNTSYKRNICTGAVNCSHVSFVDSLWQLLCCLLLLSVGVSSV